MKRNKQFYVRKAHRFLGVFLGIQFLLWTIGGLYFSWTDIDEIHGDHLVKQTDQQTYDIQLLNLPDLRDQPVRSIALINIVGEPYFFVNENSLFHAETGVPRKAISKEEAIKIAGDNLKKSWTPVNVVLLEETGRHHEFRGRNLPVWQISYESEEAVTAYIDATTGNFEKVRHRQWRWFDFLWMMHTMDYAGRDDMNNLLLRVFSVLGLVTVFSGFALFFLTTRKRAYRGKQRR